MGEPNNLLIAIGGGIAILLAALAAYINGKLKSPGRILPEGTTEVYLDGPIKAALDALTRIARAFERVGEKFPDNERLRLEMQEQADRRFNEVKDELLAARQDVDATKERLRKAELKVAILLDRAGHPRDWNSD